MGHHKIKLNNSYTIIITDPRNRKCPRSNSFDSRYNPVNRFQIDWPLGTMVLHKGKIKKYNRGIGRIVSKDFFGHICVAFGRKIDKFNYPDSRKNGYIKILTDKEASPYLEELGKIKSVILGHAVADALGVPVEFVDRSELNVDPVIDMRAYGTYNMPAGTWSDDTSMSLCALDSLVSGKINYNAIMKNFGAWLRDSKYTPDDDTFDVGHTCLQAISSYYTNGNDYTKCGQRSVKSNGNGSLMRINPFVLFLWLQDGRITADGMESIFTASALTHAHKRSKIACGIYACVLAHILQSNSREAIYEGLAEAHARFANDDEYKEFYADLMRYDFELMPRDEIKSTGYVVDSLYAAIWCLLTTNTYSECVLKAVNLGNDTDSIGAIAGGLAGALYGFDSIPKEWLDVLRKRECIEEMCERFYYQNKF